MDNLDIERHGLYLYGIGSLNAGVPDDFRLEGIDGKNPLFFVEYKDIFGAVSIVPLSEFGEGALEENIKNIQWLEKKALIHEYIIEQIMKVFTIIPMRFCTIYKNADRVREVLAEQHEKFRKTLGYLENKQEWSVKVFLDQAVLAREISKFNDKVQKMEHELKACSAGKAFFLKKKLDSLIKDEVDAAGFIYADKCYQRLRRFAEHACLNKLLGKEVTGGDKDMVLNSAYLVTGNRVEEFKQEAGLLEEEYGALGLELVVSGPWPAYHFCWEEPDGVGVDE